MTSYQYRKSHCGDKTILRPSYIQTGISYRALVYMKKPFVNLCHCVNFRSRFSDSNCPYKRMHVNGNISADMKCFAQYLLITSFKTAAEMTFNWHVDDLSVPLPQTVTGNVARFWFSIFLDGVYRGSIRSANVEANIEWSVLPIIFRGPGIENDNPMDLLPDTPNCGLGARRKCWKRFSHRRLQRKPLVSYPVMHHGTCVTHVPWCIPG